MTVDRQGQILSVFQLIVLVPAALNGKQTGLATIW